MRKDNAPPVTKGNNNDNARLAQVELKSFPLMEFQGTLRKSKGSRMNSLELPGTPNNSQEPQGTLNILKEFRGLPRKSF